MVPAPSGSLVSSLWALGLISLVIGLLGVWVEPSQNGSQTDENHRFLELRQIETNPTFPVATTHGAITGKAAPPGAIASYWPLFRAEFSFYPASLVEKAQVHRVVFCQELAFAGQRRNAIPDFEHKTLYLEVVRGRNQKRYLRKVIHHEFFHMVDLFDDGILYGDERWARLNPLSFRYGSGGALAQNQSTTSLLATGRPGFLNHYSTTGVEEDKAELFAHLMVEPQVVDKLAKNDPVLAAKVARIKELLFAFCREVDEAFWQGPQQRDLDSLDNRGGENSLFSGPG